MVWLEHTIKALFPTLVLEGSPWLTEWEESQRKVFLKIMRVFLPLIGIGYLLHYFLFDKPVGLEPLDSWFKFRMSVAAACFLTLGFYATPLSKGRWYKLPAVVLTGVICYSQAKVTFYYPAAPWLYPFVFVLASCLMLRLSAFQSLLFTGAAIGTFFSVLIESGVDSGTLLSATLVILVVVGVTRSSYSFEITNFLLNKTNAAQQSTNMELQREFSDRIKSFIPKVIAERIQDQVDRNNASVMEASINVLRAKKKPIACLFSDIRGFTQGSKNLDEYINDSVMPEVKASSKKIETFEGIPRKVGDLIFAYFDSDILELNIVRSLLSGISLSRMNRAFNETVSSVEIRRYILVSSGEAVVGNLGGIDSSVEITALGSPVNFLSRLDDATKNPRLAELLKPGDIIISAQSIEALSTFSLNLDIRSVCLAELDVEIRDFPETSKVFVMKPSNQNWTVLMDLYSDLFDRDPSSLDTTY